MSLSSFLSSSFWHLEQKLHPVGLGADGDIRTETATAPTLLRFRTKPRDGRTARSCAGKKTVVTFSHGKVEIKGVCFNLMDPRKKEIGEQFTAKSLVLQ